MSKISANKTNINKIKRLLLMLLVCTVVGELFLGCGSNGTMKSKDDYDFILIKKDIEIEDVDTLCKSALYYDKKTKIVYIWVYDTNGFGGYSVLYNASGTPMTLDEYNNYED